MNYGNYHLRGIPGGWAVVDEGTKQTLGEITRGWHNSRAYSNSCFTRYHTLWDARLPDGRVQYGLWYRSDAAEWVIKHAATPRSEDPTATYGAGLPYLGGRPAAWRSLRAALDAGGMWAPHLDAPAYARIADLRRVGRRRVRQLALSTETADARPHLVGAVPTAPGSRCVIGGEQVAQVIHRPVPTPGQLQRITKTAHAVPLDRPWTVEVMCKADALPIPQFEDRVALRDALAALPVRATSADASAVLAAFAPATSAAA
ncbi:hypothetical protein KIH27_02210 [Mycobacterium sp. M1]|uniref:Uncharacterized protein n=1 Tax=Mycolicibacter acidiphilus TaxID=2835306 RepID=A0ABS5RHH2_9MYCO|nr:hypothetical protein [Mycolicibacter acidiphilus]MBS9532399.1 hypothetical protein [Mycolicibacter acidiphilus]